MSAAEPLKFTCNSCTNTAHAALKGRIGCLVIAHKHEYPWHSMTTYYAAGHGHLDCLQFAYEHGCPWHSETAFHAATFGHLECLQYIYENCGDVATWEQSGLEDFEENDQISEHIKKYLRSVQDDWKCGRNICTVVKPARSEQ